MNPIGTIKVMDRSVSCLVQPDAVQDRSPRQPPGCPAYRHLCRRGAGVKLFTEGGKSVTGSWAHPDTVFTLKNEVDGNQLDEARIDGPNCPA